MVSAVSRRVRESMEPESVRIVSVDQLPDNPLEMPPPYWRSLGAVCCLLGAAESIVQLLEELVPVHERTQVELEAHFEKHPEGAQTDEIGRYGFTGDDNVYSIVVAEPEN
jgi:hypothetical protein